MLPVENYSVQQQNEATDTLQGTCRQQVDLPVEAPSTNAEEMMVKPICKRNCIDTERIIMREKLRRRNQSCPKKFEITVSQVERLEINSLSVQATTNWLQIIHCHQRDIFIMISIFISILHITSIGIKTLKCIISCHFSILDNKTSKGLHPPHPCSVFG